MSRAELRVPPAPRLAPVLRTAALDLYYHGTRLVVANLAVGLLTLGLVAGGLWLGPLVLPLLVLLVPPAAGLMRLATRVIREGHAVLSDFTSVLRHPGQSLLIGAFQLAVTIVLLVDIGIGVAASSLPGTFLAVSAVYGLAAWWALAFAFWPIHLDPIREGQSVRASARLAVMLLIAHPLRIGGTALLTAAFLVASMILVAAILTIAVAYAWLVAAHYVLPAADRLEGRATLRVEG